MEVLGQSVLGGGQGGLQHSSKQAIGAGRASSSQALPYCPVWLSDRQRTDIRDQGYSIHRGPTTLKAQRQPYYSPQLLELEEDVDLGNDC